MPDTFTWVPDDKPAGDVSFTVREVRFGDGYRQVSPDGINTKQRRWNLSFDRDEAEIEAIKAFLDSHVGERFYWTPPGLTATQSTYIANGYRESPYSGNQNRLAVTFEEFIGP